MWSMIWQATSSVLPTLVGGFQTQDRQGQQHQYTLAQQRAQSALANQQQAYANELRKDFQEFETRLQRETDAIRWGGSCRCRSMPTWRGDLLTTLRSSMR
jgi:hypothetical protein